MIPEEKLARKIEEMLINRMRNGDIVDTDSLWPILTRGLPEVPHLPLQLLIAWGKLPEHYNFWLDRAGYESGDSWWQKEASQVEELADNACNMTYPVSSLPFISIDSATTQDIDDAFYIEKQDEGWRIVIALAAPAVSWPFESALDKKVFHRSTSIYLPEGDLHMLPKSLGTSAWSLHANSPRTAFCLDIRTDAEGRPLSCDPAIATVTLAANLNYVDVQNVLDNAGGTENPASQFSGQLLAAHSFARAREKLRIENGAIIMRKPEQHISLEKEGDETLVRLLPDPPKDDANRIVTEAMVLASAEFAKWALNLSLPILFRTQDVTIPREYAGIWTKPEDISRIMRALVPSMMETECRRHAALAEPCYAPVTSPLRRYADLVNEAQAISMLTTGAPRWDREELNILLENLLPSLEAATQVQRYRPRYWRLLYFRQQGDKRWWNGVITEENENFVTVYLPDEGIYVRGKRNLFGDRAEPGMSILLRIGKVHPLYNEIQILETMPVE